jgi:hypothetical protein
MNAEIRAVLSEAATKRWANPKFKKRLSKIMSNSAEKRWDDPVNYETEARRRGALVAESYGIPVEQWMSMTHKERDKLRYTTRKVKVSAAQLRFAKAAAKLVGMPVEEFALLTTRERKSLRHKFNKKKKKES